MPSLGFVHPGSRAGQVELTGFAPQLDRPNQTAKTRTRLRFICSVVHKPGGMRNVCFPPIADIRPLDHAYGMKSNQKVWVAIYSVAFVIFVGGWFGRVNESRYFPIFVAFCMLFGLAANIYWLRRRAGRRD